MKCPNPACPYSKIEKIEENANFCSKCGCSLSQSGETSSSKSEKSNSLSKNSTQNASETEDRHYSPLDSIGKSLHLAEKHWLRNRMALIYMRDKRTYLRFQSDQTVLLILSLYWRKRTQRPISVIFILAKK